MTKLVVKCTSADKIAESEQQILEWFLRGDCNPGNFVYSYEKKVWTIVAELPSVKNYFSQKPVANLEKNVVHIYHSGAQPYQSGPYSLSQVKQKISNGELCAHSWIFVEGDKEWRQVQNVKVLKEVLPQSPQSVPEDGNKAVPYASKLTPAPAPTPFDANRDPGVEYAEEHTKAVSALGLSLEESSVPSLETALPLKPSGKTALPVMQSIPPGVVNDPKQDKDDGSYDGITAEISAEPIWLIKKSDSENVMGPYRFLEVVKFLEEGKISKNDKISKSGTNRYLKIIQQYEFNVKFTVETVVEGGVEKQKILIRRRHPRVPYMTDVQVTRKGTVTSVSCVNISAGGILIETSKVDFSLGEYIEIKILPSLINRTIICKALIIGKIPKIPPGFALKFEDLKQEDKEAIEYFVQNALKRANV